MLVTGTADIGIGHVFVQLDQEPNSYLLRTCSVPLAVLASGPTKEAQPSMRSALQNPVVP